MKRYELRSVGGMGIDAVEIRESKSGEWVRYREVPQWVSVEKRLPEIGQIVDLWNAHETTRYADWYLDHYSPTDHRLFWYPSHEANPSAFQIPVEMSLDITHWMPLPEPPEC